MLAMNHYFLVSLNVRLYFTDFTFFSDANALYLWCTAQDMATGMYIRRRADENFKKEYPSPISFAATEWLADIEHRENIHIEHARNVGEYKVGPRRRAVDGFCRLVLVFRF